MGRGGKKKNKKDAQGDADDSKPSTSQETQEITSALTTLSISESDQPSTSKTSDKDVQHETKSEQTKPKEVKPEPSKRENTKTVEDDDQEDGLGLGLTSGRARRKRKPKGAAAQTKPSEQVQSPTGPQTTGPQQPGGLEPSTDPQQYPSGSQIPPGFEHPASVQQPCGPFPAAGAAGAYPAFPQQPGGPRPVAPSIGRGRGPPFPQHPVAPEHPPSAHPAVPQQPRGPYPAAPQPRGRGRGQGPAWGAPKQPPPGMAAVPSQAPPPAFQQRKTQEPVQFSHERSPALSSKSSDSSSSEYRRPSHAVSRFKIPEKRLLPEVPAMKIKVLANYLRLKFQDLKIHRYDVAIKPDKPKKMISKAFDETRKKYFKDHVIAFDQKKNLFALKPLTGSITEPLDVVTEIIDFNGEAMKFELVFKHTGIVDLATISNYMKAGGSTLELPMEAIQCVDVILQQATLESYVKAGRQYFKRPQNPINLTQGMEMWTGLFQSAIFNSGSFINIDVAHKGFPKHQTLLDAVINDFQMEPNKELEGQRGFEEFKHYLKGLRVTALIGGDSKTGKKREFICNGVVAPPYKLTFSMTDAAGKTSKCTVDKYFEVVKNYRLKYPRLNCLWVGPKEKNIYYPMELLEVVYGQAINKQLSDKQLPVMVREAATAPNIRLQKIHEVIQSMQYSTNPQFKKFGLDISDRLTVVDAKILKVPKLNVGNNRNVEPRRGAWQTPGLLQAQALQKWAIILLDGNPKYCQIAPIVDMLMGVGRSMGMRIDRPLVMRENVTMRDLRNTLFDMVQKGVNFVVIIFTGRDRDAYHKVKRIAELEVGVLTQCIKEFTASKKMNEQTMRNILLKINSKLMGVNQALDATCMPKCLQGGGVMLVGADVTHPSPDQSSVPSIAAVTASIDSKYFVYNIELSIQTPKREMIMQFEDMMVDHFKVYQKHNGNELPRRIYVLRDGVSDGQFAEVMNSELVALQQAYLRMAGPQAKKPEILFVLVQKRHHTRLFTTDRMAQNVEPGTVVDSDIVHQRELNFFLVSHQAIKGTARPTRYHCVCNDGNLSVGEVEQLAFYLCHLYSRCSRSVSYPTPTYYAHLACFRARSLTFGEHFDNNDLERNPKRIRVMDKMLQFSRMFFV